VRLDGGSRNVSKKAEEPAAQYKFVLQPVSAGSPQENGFAEKAAGDATRLARAFMLGAPHLPKSAWGLACAYVRHVNLLLIKQSKGGRTPYGVIHHHTPDIDQLYIRAFGCRVQFEELTGPRNKMSSRAVGGCFVGLDPPSVLVMRDTDKKVMMISPKKVRTHEAVYCKVPYPSTGKG